MGGRLGLRQDTFLAGQNSWQIATPRQLKRLHFLDVRRPKRRYRPPPHTPRREGRMHPIPKDWHRATDTVKDGHRHIHASRCDKQYPRNAFWISCGIDNSFTASHPVTHQNYIRRDVLTGYKVIKLIDKERCILHPMRRIRKAAPEEVIT